MNWKWEACALCTRKFSSHPLNTPPRVPYTYMSMRKNVQCCWLFTLLFYVIDNSHACDPCTYAVWHMHLRYHKTIGRTWVHQSDRDIDQARAKEPTTPNQGLKVGEPWPSLTSRLWRLCTYIFNVHCAHKCTKYHVYILSSCMCHYACFIFCSLLSTMLIHLPSQVACGMYMYVYMVCGSQIWEYDHEAAIYGRPALY